MTEQTEEATVIEIHPDARYALLIDRRLTADDVERFSQTLDEWWTSGTPFIVMAEIGVKLVRVDE